MSRFDCSDCVKDGTDACKFGYYRASDCSDDCDEMVVEENHSYEKGYNDAIEKFINEIDIIDECEFAMYSNQLLKEIAVKVKGQTNE